MIPRLYAAGTTVFTTEGLGALSDAISCVTTTAINGVPSLTMTYPTTGVHASEIGERCVIVADRDRTRTKQPYMVLTIDKSTPGIMKIYAEHLGVCLLDGIGLGAYTATNLSLAISTMGNYATEALPVTISTELSSSTDFNHAVPSTVKKALGGMEGSLLDTYGGEWDFVDLTAVLRTRMGADNHVIIRWGKNLSSLRVNIDWSGVYTGIYPYWENDGTVVQMASPVYSLGTFSFTRILMIDASSEFRDQPSEADLLAYAQAYAAAHDLTSPVYSWSVGFVELRGAPEYASVALLEDVSIGDTVRIYLPDFGVNATARVVKETYDVLLQQYQKLEIGAVKASLAQTITQQADAAQAAIKTATNGLYNAIQEATEAITGNKGGYIVTIMNGSGEPQELLIMDTADINTATNVWRWNVSGLGFSSTGYAGPYTTAITSSGEIVANFITAGQLAANMVTACQLTAGTIQSTDGTTFVLDLTTGNMSIDGTAGGINLKNCGINIQSSQTFQASNYSASDTTRIQQIMLGNITPTSADYEKYDFFGAGVINTRCLLSCNAMVNTGTNLVVTWYAEMDTSKSAILKVWRTTSGAISSTTTIFTVTAGGVLFDSTDAEVTRTSLEAAGRVQYSATGATSIDITLEDGEMAILTYKGNGTGAANDDVTLKVNDAFPDYYSYTYCGGGGSNYLNSGEGIFTYGGAGTFNGFISCHDGLVEVWGTGRRRTDTVAGFAYLGWNLSLASKLTVSAAGSITVTKIFA